MDMHVQEGKEDESGMNGRHTKLLPHTSRPPIGANMTPMMKSVGRTVFGVSIGCHAFRRCCLKAVSRRRNCCGQRLGKNDLAVRLTCRPSPATLLLLALAILVVCVVVAVLLAVEEAHRYGCRRRGRIRDITVLGEHSHNDVGQWLCKQGNS